MSEPVLDKRVSPVSLLKNGILADNPLLRLALGICPALAVTTRAENGLAMGCAAAFALVLTNIAASLLRGILPEKGRTPALLMLSAAFATIAHLLLKSVCPGMSAELGIYVPLIAVSCLLLSRANDVGAQQGVGSALADGVGMGIGYTAALTLLGLVREVLGRGSAFGLRVLPASYEPMLLAILPAGGFLLLGVAMGIYNAVAAKCCKAEGGAESETEDGKEASA